VDANPAAQNTLVLHESAYVDSEVLNGAVAATIQADDVNV